MGSMAALLGLVSSTRAPVPGSTEPEWLGSAHLPQAASLLEGLCLAQCCHQSRTHLLQSPASTDTDLTHPQLEAISHMGHRGQQEAASCSIPCGGACECWVGSPLTTLTQPCKLAWDRSVLSHRL